VAVGGIVGASEGWVGSCVAEGEPIGSDAVGPPSLRIAINTGIKATTNGTRMALVMRNHGRFE
jgi:hypothetical protein